MIKLGILGSTRGTNLIKIAEAIQQQKLPAQIEIVISNKPEALILARAQSFGIKTATLSSVDLSREQLDHAISDLLKQNGVELVVLIGYMRILSPAFIADWHNRIINVHPSLLPAHAGIMDLAVHRAVLEAGNQETGCTVHYVTEDVDAGPVVVQKKCQVLAGDTPEMLKERVQSLEGEALIEAISLIEKRRWVEPA